MSEHFISAEEARGDLTYCAAFIAETLSGDHHAAAMSAVLPNFLAKDNVDLAAELANTVDDPYTRDRLLQLVAERCAEIGDDEYAVQLADAVEEFGLRSQTFEKIAVKKIAAGDVDKGIEIAETLSHPDSVYAAAAMKHAADGSSASAKEMLAKIEYAPEKIYAVIGIASAAFDAGKPDEAAKVLDDAAAAVEAVDHDEEKLRVLRDIGNLYAEVGRKDEAAATFEKMAEFALKLDNVNRDGFLGSAAIGLLRSEKPTFAAETLNAVADKTQRSTALLGFSKEHWRADRKDEAFDALEESLSVLRSQRDTETRDTPAKNALLSSIAIQFAGYGKDERAAEIAEENDDDMQVLSSLSQIAQIAAAQGDLESAKHTLNSIEDDSYKVFALIGVADAVRKNGDDAAAAAMLDEAVSVAETIPQLSSKASAYVELSNRFLAAGRNEESRTNATRALLTVCEIRGEATLCAKLAELANVYERSGFELNDEELERLNILVNSTLL